MSQEDLLPWDKGLDVGPPGTRLPPSQAQVSITPKTCISPDVAEPPSSFRPKGVLLHHDTATSVAAICVSMGTRTGHKTLGVHSAERSEEESVAQSSPDRGAMPSPGQRSPGKTSVEMPPSGPSLISSQQEEGRVQGEFSSWGQYGCGEVAVQCAASGSEGGTCQAEGLITPRSVTAPADQAQPAEVPKAPLRSIQRTSLEGMRKQTPVELSDTSSDDEDRLVIEI